MHPSPIDQTLKAKAALTQNVEASDARAAAVASCVHPEIPADWRQLQDPAQTLEIASWFIQSEPDVGPAILNLLRSAHDELDRGGSRIFELYGDCEDGTNYVEPILSFIRVGFTEGILAFVDAGFDPEKRYGIDDLNAYDVCRERGRPDLEAAIRAGVARREAIRVLQGVLTAGCELEAASLPNPASRSKARSAP